MKHVVFLDGLCKRKRSIFEEDEVFVGSRRDGVARLEITQMVDGRLIQVVFLLERLGDELRMTLAMRRCRHIVDSIKLPYEKE